MRDRVEMTVKLVVFDDKAFRLSRNLFFQVESFINDEDVVEAHRVEYGIEQEEFDHIKERYRREREYERYYPMNRPTGVLDFSDECELPENAEFGEIHVGSVGGSSKKSSKAESGSTYKKTFNEHSFDKNLYMNDGKEELPFQKHLLQLIIDRDLDNTILNIADIFCEEEHLSEYNHVREYYFRFKESLNAMYAYNLADDLEWFEQVMNY